MPATMPLSHVELSEADYEKVTLAHWLRQVPEAEDISVTVRDHDGRAVRFVLISRNGAEVIDPAAALSSEPAS